MIRVKVLMIMFRGLVIVLMMFCKRFCIGERLMFCVKVGLVIIKLVRVSDRIVWN